MAVSVDCLCNSYLQNMDDKRKINQKSRGVRKFLDYHSCDDLENDEPKKISEFKFPPPPKVLPVNSPSKSFSPLWQSISDMETTSDSQSDNGARETSSPVTTQHRNKVCSMRGYQSDGSPVTTLSRCLPPIGVFWDIENCQIPRGRSAVTVAQTIRDRFFDGYREVEFLVVCDVKKETAQVVQELNDAQVNLIHVGATSKNAADEKLRQSIRRFADIHGSPSAVILISGDINFAPDLCDLRHRKKVHVILIHNEKCSESLILCANEHYNFSSLVSNLPYRISNKAWNQPSEVLVTNLPAGQDHGRIRHRLKRLAENCGGRVGFITGLTTTIRFPSLEAAERAQKRMDGEKVFGSSINVSGPVKATDFKEGSPLKSNLNRQISIKMDDTSQHTPPQQYSMFLPTTLFNPPTASATVHNWQRLTHNGSSFPHLHDLGGSGDNGLMRSKSMVNTTNPLMYNPEQLKASPGLGWNQRWNWTNQNTWVQPKGRPILGARDQDNSSKTTDVTNTPNRERAASATILKRTRAESPTTETVLNGAHKFQMPTPLPLPANKPVELYVTNLDKSIDPLELKRILMSTFKDYVMVLHVAVFVQPNGNLTASIKVPSVQAAQTAIAQLQKHKVGLNHIKIGYAESGQTYDAQLLRSQVVSVLSHVPGFRLPLLKFCDQFENRYGTSVDVPSLYTLQETCTVTEEAFGLVISLNMQQKKPVVPEKKFCRGCTRKTVPDQNTQPLPNVRIELSLFSKRLQDLVSNHDDVLPLSSLVRCYEAEFGSLTVDDSGVPLEHLVTWVSNVELFSNTQGVKHIRSVGTVQTVKEGSDDGSKENVSPSQAQLIPFSHELAALLRAQPHNQLLLSQFIPLYHKHFSRQCRVADYGFNKLIDLLEAVPQTIQIIGEGSRRTLVLTRRNQLRQFTTDLFRVLRSQSSKQFSITQFDTLYESVFGRRFDPVYYGLCYIDDLLAQVNDSSVVVTGKGPSCVVAIAKRDQTKEEIERTRQFSLEIFELLSIAPHYKMTLNKITPAYHQHFKRQCRMADYGFTKMIQLFDVIPDVVKVDEDDKQRYISLTNEKKMKVLSSQILELVSTRFPPGLQVANVTSAFACRFGFDLIPEAYGCTNLQDLLEKLHSVKVCNTDGDVTLIPVDQSRIQLLSLRVRRVLMERPNGKMTLVDFQRLYQQLFDHNCSLEELERDLGETVKVSRDRSGEITVQLTSLQLFARDVYRLLLMSEGRLALSSFEATYLRTIGTAVQPTQYGYSDVVTLLKAIPHTVLIRGKGSKQILIFNKEIQEAGLVLPSSLSKGSPSQESVKGLSSPRTSLDAGCVNTAVSDQDSKTLFQSQIDLVKGLVRDKTPEAQTTESKPDITTLVPTLVSLPHIKAPDPSELPLPQLLTNKQEQQTMSVESSKEDVCVLAVDLLKQTTCSNLDVDDSGMILVNNKRKMRLAAQFQTPIQLI